MPKTFPNTFPTFDPNLPLTFNCKIIKRRREIERERWEWELGTGSWLDIHVSGRSIWVSASTINLMTFLC